MFLTGGRTKERGFRRNLKEPPQLTTVTREGNPDKKEDGNTGTIWAKGGGAA